MLRLAWAWAGPLPSLGCKGLGGGAGGGWGREGEEQMSSLPHMQSLAELQASPVWLPVIHLVRQPEAAHAKCDTCENPQVQRRSG